jgi:large subunit ribosomal protein L22
MEVVATAKWVRMTARKVRLVAEMVEGMPVNEALTILNFTPRYAAREVGKVIKSAAANAEHNYQLDVASLRVARIEVEGAAIIKRMRAKPRGMSGSIFKRTAHLRAYVSDDVKLDARKRGRGLVTRAGTGPVAAAPAAAAAKPAPARTRSTTPKKTTATKAPAKKAPAKEDEA